MCAGKAEGRSSKLPISLVTQGPLKVVSHPKAESGLLAAQETLLWLAGLSRDFGKVL